MIVFKLTMPNRGSWNGRWSGEENLYVKVRDERYVPKKLWDKAFFYTWDDGWTACVSVQRLPAKEARKLDKKSKGFCGYDWMITSLINDGYIHTMRKGEK